MNRVVKSKIQLPTDFQNRMKGTLGAEYSDFENSLQNSLPTSIHIHPIKGDTLLNKYPSHPISWCRHGQYLNERPIFTVDPAFHAGAYYVQEASSMFLEPVFELAKGKQKNLKVLDLCASPGGKSTLLLSLLLGEGLLVSNEVISGRVSSLRHNITKWGFPNQVITSSDPSNFSALRDFFDIILVDAPCSGEGLFRKEPNAVNEWSLKNTQTCALRQSRILEDVLPSLKPGGHLIYSTCTFNPAENLDQVSKLVLQGYESIRMPSLVVHKMEELCSDKGYGYQAYPHKLKGEGFFISLLRKAEDSPVQALLRKNHINSIKPGTIERYIDISSIEVFQHNDFFQSFSSSNMEDLRTISSYCRIISAGTTLGSMKGNDFVPDHGLSQSVLLKENLQSVDLGLKQAIEYLKKNTLENHTLLKGYVLVKYQGHRLGWLKAVPGRYNNLYPNEYRIMGKF